MSQRRKQVMFAQRPPPFLSCPRSPTGRPSGPQRCTTWLDKEAPLRVSDPCICWLSPAGQSSCVFPGVCRGPGGAAFGKDTVGYTRYRDLVPRESRGKDDPQTPDFTDTKQSKRSFDGVGHRLVELSCEGRGL